MASKRESRPTIVASRAPSGDRAKPRAPRKPGSTQASQKNVRRQKEVAGTRAVISAASKTKRQAKSVGTIGKTRTTQLQPAATALSSAPIDAAGRTPTDVAASQAESNAGSTVPRVWWLYLLECRDGALYAGISPDVAARFRAHTSGRGARYTRANPPLRILGAQRHASRSAASVAEYALKQLRRADKLIWAQQHGWTSPVPAIAIEAIETDTIGINAIGIDARAAPRPSPAKQRRAESKRSAKLKSDAV